MSKPIPVSQASAMIKTYDNYMASLGVDMKTQTQSVSFTLPELMAWLNKMTPIADEIRIFMGDYPAGNPNAGRTSLVLWPYKNGKPARTTDTSLATEPGEEQDPGDPGDPADPFNEGHLNP
jgi:hypothetical protein